MNPHDQLWRKSLRDAVVIIKVTAWIEGIAIACGLLMIQGLLSLMP